MLVAMNWPEPEWFDDPCFDDMEETCGGKSFCGDSWRQLMAAKAQGFSTVISVAGTCYKQEALESALKSGKSEVTLRAEPTNPFDKHAMQVLISDHHVGYVTREMQKAVSPDSRAKVCRWSMAPPHIWLAVSA